MAKKPANGTVSWETPDWMARGVQDSVSGRAAAGSVPAAYQAAYTEAYNWGAWFKLQLKRNSI
jgi:hypothetical protein